MGCMRPVQLTHTVGGEDGLDDDLDAGKLSEVGMLGMLSPLL